VFFTDGITEATSADDVEFGDDRLVEAIRRHRTAPADALARTLSDAVSAWTGGTFQDDATLIVLARE
jgi:serine phosphatase RsbU (regulator of sigma subunit)